MSRYLSASIVSSLGRTLLYKTVLSSQFRTSDGFQLLFKLHCIPFTVSSWSRRRRISDGDGNRPRLQSDFWYNSRTLDCFPCSLELRAWSCLLHSRAAHCFQITAPRFHGAADEARTGEHQLQQPAEEHPFHQDCDAQ